MPEYQGHKNWNHWNVALWLANDEPLYRLALRCKKQAGARGGAALLLKELHAGGKEKTPDGAVFNVTTLRAALQGLE